ncbi:hypothetical protein GCM10011591_37520 [Nocardia camponoti]|uniref:Uncharacterized protein n=1 Tax=Nocardia camponoti TaxID=1616106 RepID=A0A917QQ98_9NOCA|nr:hypothetical protein GCM10011591_37520 [Nocardia camponoti]
MWLTASRDRTRIVPAFPDSMELPSQNSNRTAGLAPNAARTNGSNAAATVLSFPIRQLCPAT